MAMKGMKHLVKTVMDQNKNNKLVFTTNETKKQGYSYYISYKNYKKFAQDRFYALYSETGLDAAKIFLSSQFPNDFQNPKGLIKQSEYKKVEKNISEVIRELLLKEKNQKVLIEELTKMLERLKDEKKQLREEKKMLRSEISSLELQKLQQESTIVYYTRILDELSQRLNGNKTYHETHGKNSWQNWIYENNWLFGIQYQLPIQKEQIGFDNIPDFLFPTLDGFIDILEIKLPTANVIVSDPSHPGSYSWSSETNRAIGQVINYIHQMELNQLQLKERITEEYGDLYNTTIFTIKPRAYILIGQSDDWSTGKKQAFRKLNYALHGIEVLTYTDLIIRGKSVISLVKVTGDIT